MITKKISFKVEGDKLTGTLFSPEISKPSSPAVMFLHGWKGDEKGYMKRAVPLTKLGYICMSFNLRGHGTSDGDIKKVTLSDSLKDAVAAYDFLHSQKRVNRNAIHGVGSSYGGYLAARLSAERKLKSLVLRVPAIYRDEDFKKRKHTISISHLDLRTIKSHKPHNNMALNAISKFGGPILLIESEHDDKIPHAIIENCIKSAKEGKLTYKLMVGASHSLNTEGQKKEFVDLMTAWFKEQKIHNKINKPNHSIKNKYS
jgi:uncharacterized protein